MRIDKKKISHNNIFLFIWQVDWLLLTDISARKFAACCFSYNRESEINGQDIFEDFFFAFVVLFTYSFSRGAAWLLSGLGFMVLKSR